MTLDDKELVAMSELYRILQPFDRAIQERMATYVMHRLLIETSMREQREYASQQALGINWGLAAQGRLS